MTEARAKHVQQTFLSLGDEFLVQYFLCAHSGFRGNQILSRLFSMGHSLELYAKARLVSDAGVPPHGHNIPELVKRCDPSLALTPEEIAAGEALFGANVTNVDLGLWFAHDDAMELYQAEHFVVDLKYYITKQNCVLFPARKSLQPVNSRYLQVVRSLRLSLRYRDREHDQRLVALVEQLGFERNPALDVVAADHDS